MNEPLEIERQIFDTLEHGLIKPNIDKIAGLLAQLETCGLADQERVWVTNQIRVAVQKEAESAVRNNNRIGMVLMATGTGKSKIAVDITAKIINANRFREDPPKILLVVPTEKLRDEGWKEEFTKWGYGADYNGYIERTCYASLNNYKDTIWDFVIADECHNITENNGVFFENNIIHSAIALTATYPKDKIKQQLLTKYHFEVVYEINLDEAVKLGLVTPYDITVITMPLNSRDKTIRTDYKDKKTGQAKSFVQTEKEQYDWLTKSYARQPSKEKALKRMRFIYNLKTKTDAIKWVLNNLIPPEKRTLIFCGSKKQANEVCSYRYYSKPTQPKKLKAKPTPKAIEKYEIAMMEYDMAVAEYQGNTSYEAFANKEIPKMSCVDALNEGHNIPDLDIAGIGQLNSSDLRLTQRIGRAVRFRPGHTANILIFAVEGTVDMAWVGHATAGLDQSKIRLVKLADLKEGKETISFDN